MKKKIGIKSIGIKMLLGILPVVVLALAFLTRLSETTGRDLIEEQSNSNMQSELKANVNSINDYLNVVETTAMNIAYMVGSSYQTTEIDTYGAAIKNIISDNDLILGSGIWFEPNVYDSQEKYMGPYWYKEDGKIELTYDYSEASYDYFNQDYYKMAASGTGEAVITDPYYDSTLDTMMASCTAPIYDGNNKFIGAVTVDMQLSDIDTLIQSIKVGKNGTAMLTNGKGVYLCETDKDKVTNAVNITQDENGSLAAAAAVMVSSDKGKVSYEEGEETYNLYYDTVPGVGWIIMIKMPQSELEEPIVALNAQLVKLSAIALICCIAAVLLQVGSITSGLKRVKKFAGSLADGDFTIQPLKSRRKDELGQMSSSLNNMFKSNKQVIERISGHAGGINDASVRLNTVSSDLLQQFHEIKTYMADVDKAMMSSSAATEEVNASMAEVNTSVGVLAEETGKSSRMAGEIMERAKVIEKNSREAYENAIGISREREQDLQMAVENAKVVEKIGDMARIISNTASQINLLSLNASIEAVRAGEQGKGFAVVAREIGKLAKDTSETVKEIEGTIDEVQKAFGMMMSGSESMLNFLKDTVTPDYNNFADVGQQYGRDAVSIEEISNEVAEMAGNISQVMQEVRDAIQNVSESVQTTAGNSSMVLTTVEKAYVVVQDMSKMSERQEHIAEELNTVVSGFKLK
ncbi:methyl-accepting chemotaxis protein [Clostridium sp. Marseille-P2415]|uniref:methyl-accepting chemotaxis protein n=1 Tax=Clostridium sp. Marseille-P2415 TaxID=1805471 RepID=UPI0009884C77|nr:methyl-accepting chemotaxis protein [Clostridium sp. Marseille-P2415]